MGESRLSKDRLLKVLIILLLFLAIPPFIAYIIPLAPPNHAYYDTSSTLRAGVSSFTAYDNDNGTTIIGGSTDGIFVYRPWDYSSMSMMPANHEEYTRNYDASDWTFSKYVYESSVLTVRNKTPITVAKLTEYSWMDLFTIEDTSIVIGDVQITSNPDTVYTYLSFGFHLYVYNHQGEQLSKANITALQYGIIESISSSSTKVVITTPSGFGVYDPVTNTTTANLIEQGEIYRARPAVACNRNCDTIYVGRNDGLFIYALEGVNFTQTGYFTKHQGLPANSITSLWLDEQTRRLYIGTKAGLVAFDTDENSVIQQPLLTSEITAIYSNDDTVYAATMNGVYIIPISELETQVGYWESTSSFWINVYPSLLTFPIAWLSLALHVFRKKDED